MSNPFLTQNRFKVLDEDNRNVNAINKMAINKMAINKMTTNKMATNKIETNKTPIMNQPTDRKSTNIFTRPPSDKPSYNRDNYRHRRRPYDAPPVEPPKPTFQMETQLFPELIHVQPNMETSTVTNGINYKDVVSTQLPAVVKKQEVPEGWVEITKKGNKLQYNYGRTSAYCRRMDELVEMEKTPHYIMNTAITQILKQRDEYMEKYNSFHGEGAYEDKYVLEPAYGSEYESEEDSDEEKSESDIE